MSSDVWRKAHRARPLVLRNPPALATLPEAWRPFIAEVAEQFLYSRITTVVIRGGINGSDHRLSIFLDLVAEVAGLDGVWDNLLPPVIQLNSKTTYRACGDTCEMDAPCMIDWADLDREKR